MKLKYKTRRRYNGGWFWFIDIHTGKVNRAQMYAWITTFDDYSWHVDQKRWISHTEQPRPTSGYSISHIRCRTVKEFRRKLRQWRKYLPKGIEFILHGRIEDFMVTGTT